MGRLLRNIAIGVALNFALSKLSATASNVASKQINWTLEPLRREDLGATVRQGRVMGLIKARIKVVNLSPVAITLQGYQAILRRNGELLASLGVGNSGISLPPQQPVVLTAEFVVPGNEFTAQLRQLIDGQTRVLDPIDIAGQLIFSNGLKINIDNQLRFFSLT